ncbi:6-phospho-beta-glucosidase [Pengzhenrongella frigida]|uniref:6-phospho-beta-glucosidase n=1 Tax=Pengzhenrongella frigida TaxID=1259133 RepID=A0A4Q5N3Y3_9MICO|nr:6-phospho-beta-glucosidase [Cellulomonas sp. HLT2-17]RYV52969.1 6-phospho-beta-glucosidase [Cellulomonas sp. HLT2-17]
MKLTLLGGGGFRVPQVFEAIAADDAVVRIDELVLYDTDPSRLGAIRAVIAQLEQGRTFAPTVTATTDLDEAVTGADFVFCAIRVGGAEGRTFDERIALDLGVLGQETTGPGGLAYAIRTLPVMLAIAERVKVLAPEAWFINFTNPAGIVTEALRRVLGMRVVGICDTPIGLLRRAAVAITGSPVVDTFDYVGLNHLGWLRSMEVDGRDRLPELLADPARLVRIEEARLMGLDWVQALGALPNEYLYYYYANREAVTRIRFSESTRGEFLLHQQADFYGRAAAEPGHALELWERTKHEREATYMAEGRPKGQEHAREEADLEDGGYQQVALNLMAALATGRRSTMILNVRNGDVVPGLPADAVVEVPCTVDADGVHPHRIAPVGGHMLALLQTVKAVEQLTIEAVVNRSATLAWKAIALHPLVDSVGVGRDLLERYRQQIPGVGAALDG